MTFRVHFTCCHLAPPAPWILPCVVDPGFYRPCSRWRLYYLFSLVGLPDVSCFLAAPAFGSIESSVKLRTVTLTLFALVSVSSGKFLIDPPLRNWFHTITPDYKLFWTKICVVFPFSSWQTSELQLKKALVGLSVHTEICIIHIHH